MEAIQQVQKSLDLKEECSQCGKWVVGLTDTSTGPVCDECLEDFFLCVDCEEYKPDGELTSTVNGPVCDECCDNYICCDSCGEWVLNDDAVLCDDSVYCESCGDENTFCCADCGERNANNAAVNTAGGDSICERCYENNYFCCENCQEVFHNDNLMSTDFAYYCERCYPGNDDNGVIHDYHHKPNPVFHHMPKEKDKLYIGVELETEGDCDCAEGCLEWSDGEDRYWLEHDSSLDRGFELVTHPCTLAYHMERFPWVSVCDYLKDNRFKSHNTETCGLHIHISKRPLSPADQIKIGLFMGFNAEKIKILGRRDYNTYCKRKYIDKKINADCSPDRYEAVNFTNYKTIEFRFFRGSIKADTIKAAIQFCHALVGYCKQNGFPTLVRPCWNEFVAYVKGIKEYKLLYTYLLHKNIGGESCV